MADDATKSSKENSLKVRVDSITVEIDQLEKQAAEIVRKRTRAQGAYNGAQDLLQRTKHHRAKRMMEMFRICGAILKQLMQHKWAWPFCEPVNVVELGLHDYYQIVKHPMDLGTVKQRLDLSLKFGKGQLNPSSQDNPQTNTGAAEETFPLTSSCASAAAPSTAANSSQSEKSISMRHGSSLSRHHHLFLLLDFCRDGERCEENEGEGEGRKEEGGAVKVREERRERERKESERKISKFGYQHPLQFRDDVRLVFRNATLYNEPASDVHVMAKTIKGKFEEKWKGNLQPKIREEEKRRSAEDSEFIQRGVPRLSERTREEREAQKKHSRMLKQLDRLEEELDELHKHVSVRCRPMSLEEKRALGRDLSLLPDENLNRVLEIVKKRGKGGVKEGGRKKKRRRREGVQAEDDEMEEEGEEQEEEEEEEAEEEEVVVDLDEMDPSVLWHLHRYAQAVLSSSPSPIKEGEKEGGKKDGQV